MAKIRANADSCGQLRLPIEEDQADRRSAAGSARRKEAVREALKSCLEGLDRDAVAAELSRLTGENITAHTINNWVADSKTDRRFPAEYANAFSRATKSLTVIEAMLPAGYVLLSPDQVPFYELGRLTAEDRERAKLRRQVLGKLGI